MFILLLTFLPPTFCLSLVPSSLPFPLPSSLPVLSRGRSFSPCYRFMSRWGDWVWVRSKSYMLYNPISHLPEGIAIYTWIVRLANLMSHTSHDVTCLSHDVNETSQVKGQNEISSFLPHILRNVCEFKTNLPSNINIPFLETTMAEVTV